MRFEYELPDETDFSETDLPLACLVGPKPTEKAQIQIEEGQRISIFANHEGWLFLAKLCTEMAFKANEDPAFHLHLSSDFRTSESEEKDAISLFIK